MAQSAQQVDPTNADAGVPPVVYQSVFADTPTGVERASLDWRAANAEVGQFKRGHVDILKWEASQIPPAAAQNQPNPPSLPPTSIRRTP